MTPKARVLAAYKDAAAALWGSTWVVHRTPSLLALTLGTGRTAREAWADAAAKLEKKP